MDVDIVGIQENIDARVELNMFVQSNMQVNQVLAQNETNVKREMALEDTVFDLQAGTPSLTRLSRSTAAEATVNEGTAYILRSYSGS